MLCKAVKRTAKTKSVQKQMLNHRQMQSKGLVFEYAGFDKFINDFTIGQSRIHTLEKFRSR